MVSSITSLTGSGLKDWFVQRITAVYFAAYVIVLFAFFLKNPALDYSTWKMWFHCIYFKIATVFALTALILHSWIGLWTVTTDYLRCTVLRLSVQLLILFVLLSQFIWGLMIVWGQ